MSKLIAVLITFMTALLVIGDFLADIFMPPDVRAGWDENSAFAVLVWFVVMIILWVKRDK